MRNIICRVHANLKLFNSFLQETRYIRILLEYNFIEELKNSNLL